MAVDGDLYEFLDGPGAKLPKSGFHNNSSHLDLHLRIGQIVVKISGFQHQKASKFIFRDAKKKKEFQAWIEHATTRFAI